jgi:hypothetical protein
MLDAVRAGCPFGVAAGYAGISRPTWHRYLAQGEHDLLEGVDSVHARLVVDLRRAEDEAVAQATFVIRRGMASDWKAAIEFLKRRYPGEWSDKVEVHQRRGEEQAAVAAMPPDEQRDVALALLAD